MKIIKLESENLKQTILDLVRKEGNSPKIAEYGYTGILIGDTVYYNEQLNVDELIISINKELIIPGIKSKSQYELLKQNYLKTIEACKKTISAIEYEQSICVYEDSYFNDSDYERAIKKEEVKMQQYHELIDTIFYYQVCTQCATIGNCMGGEIFTCKKHLVY